jgi:hydrogenase maturation protein HypF
VARALFGSKGRELEIVERLIASGFNSPPSSGCGRFFDAVAAVLGVCERSTYEGQAAIELGELVREPREGRDLEPYPFRIEGDVILPAGTIAGVVADLERGRDRAFIATRFHNTVLEMVREGVRRVANRTGLDLVALSGGTWQNRYLFARAKEELARDGFRVIWHREVPANDGGLCLGQAAIARARALQELV